MKKLSWLLAPTLLLAFSACGGDDDDSDAGDGDTDSTEDADQPSGDSDASRDDYVVALLDSMDDEDSFGDDEDNECVAGAIVDVIGLENLQGEVSPDELATAEDLEALGLDLDPGAWWDTAGECTDMDGWLMGEVADGDAEVAACLLENTTAEQRRAVFVAGSDGSDPSEANAALEAATATCVPE